MPVLVVRAFFLRDGLAGASAFAEKQVISRTNRFLPIPIAQIVKKNLELLATARWHLDTRQDTTVIGTVISIVKQTDIPTLAHGCQKLQQRTGSLRELETIEHFILETDCPTTDHVAYMELGYFIVRQVLDGIPLIA